MLDRSLPGRSKRLSSSNLSTIECLINSDLLLASPISRALSIALSILSGIRRRTAFFFEDNASVLSSSSFLLLIDLFIRRPHGS